MSTEGKIALFDIDNTLAYYEDKLNKDLAKLKSPEEPDIDIHSNNVPEYLKERSELIRTVPGWWSTLPVIEHMKHLLIECLLMGYDTNVLTKGPIEKYHAWTEKIQWCRENLPNTVTPIIVGGKESKGLVYGKVLADDWPGYVKAWLKYRPRGLALVPSMYYNQELNTHPNVFMVTPNNVHAAKHALEIAYERKDGEPLDISKLK